MFIPDQISDKPIDTQSPCCDPHKAKVGIYWAAVTVVALGVIFGSLVLIFQYYCISWGPLNGLIHSLGEHTFLPLAVSGGLLLALGIGGIIWKKCSENSTNTEVEELEDKTPGLEHKLNQTQQMLEDQIKTLENTRTQAQLIDAAREGKIETIRSALAQGSVSNPTRLLLEAASGGHADLITLLLENNKADPKYLDSTGYAPIHRAVRCSDCSAMNALLQKDPSLANITTEEKKLTPLHLAVNEQSAAKEKVELLIRSGANVNALDADNNTPLLVAISRQYFGGDPNIEVIECLMKAGAHLTKDKHNKTFAELANTYHRQWLEQPKIKDRLKACGIDI